MAFIIIYLKNLLSNGVLRPNANFYHCLSYRSFIDWELIFHESELFWKILRFGTESKPIHEIFQDKLYHDLIFLYFLRKPEAHNILEGWQNQFNFIVIRGFWFKYKHLISALSSRKRVIDFIDFTKRLNSMHHIFWLYFHKFSLQKFF